MPAIPKEEILALLEEETLEFLTDQTFEGDVPDAIRQQLPEAVNKAMPIGMERKGLEEDILEERQRQEDIFRRVQRIQINANRAVNDVLAGVEGVLRRLAGKGVELTIACAPDVGLVQAAPQEIERILLNLVVNARQAITGAGTITLVTSNAQVDHVGEEEIGPVPYVMISVSDDGTGIDEETRARLFEPFFTTREDGTGLGLAIVYDIVARSHGHVQVESEPGHGTTFRIYLPRIDDDRTAGRSTRG